MVIAGLTRNPLIFGGSCPQKHDGHLGLDDRAFISCHSLQKT